MQKKNKAKHLSQQKAIDAIDKIFLKSLRKRDSMIVSPNRLRDKIITIDLLISELIKKRARLTAGGYNYILEAMWDWQPHFPMKKCLLPKTAK